MKKVRVFFAFLVAVVLAVCCCSCAKAKAVTEVTVKAAKNAKVVYIDDTLQLNATVTGGKKITTDVEWSVAEGGDFATVDETGLVKGVAEGDITVRATSKYDTTKYGELKLNVYSSVYVSKIALNTSNAKLLYDIGDEFTSEGLVINAERADILTGQPAESCVIPLDSASLTINSSSFDKAHEGSYTIYVTYHEKVTEMNVSENFKVDVKKSAGISVTKEKVEYEFNDKKGTTVRLNDLTVKTARAVNGIDETELPSDSYTVTCFNEKQQKVEFTGESIKINTPGTYQLWVTVKDYTIPGTTEKGDFDAFVLIYVLDPLVQIKLKQGEGVFSQAVSPVDEMTETWKYVAVYTSGRQVELGRDDVTIEDVDVTGAAENAEALVIRTETDGKGTTVRKTTTVLYTVTDSGSAGRHDFIYSYTKLTEILGANATDKHLITNSEIAGTELGFITIEDSLGTAQFRKSANTSSSCLEIQNTALSFEVKGKALVTIEFHSTGGSNTSDLAIVNAENENVYIKATNERELKAGNFGDEEGVYQVEGTSSVKFRFAILTPGTYRLLAGIENNRFTRIQTFTINDWYED